MLTDLIVTPCGINHDDNKSMLTNPKAGENTRICAKSNFFLLNAKVKPNPTENKKKKIAIDVKKP
jgi:hypothetical protein